jgi:hypothetical protein
MEEFDGCIRGHHISRTHWCPSIGKELLCKREEQNRHDPYAVAIFDHEKTRGAVVGHIPIVRKISAACSLFLRRNGTILCTVTARRHFSED